MCHKLVKVRAHSALKEMVGVMLAHSNLARLGERGGDPSKDMAWSCPPRPAGCTGMRAAVTVP